MSHQKDHKKQFDANDIRRYFSGEMNTSEMHELEKAALDDPFLADAMEGYESMPSAQMSSDLNELSARLNNKTSGKLAPIVSIRRKGYRYAAAVALIIFAIGGSWLILNQKIENNMVASEKAKDKKEAPAVADSIQNNTATTEHSSTQGLTDKVADSQVASQSKNSKPDSRPDVAKKNLEPVAAPTAEAPVINDERTNSAKISNEAVLNKAKTPERDEYKKKEVLEESSSARKVPNAAPEASAGKANDIQGFIGTHLIVGKVVDKDGHPLPFVNVRVNNTNNHSYTNAAGEFKIVSGDTALDVQLKSVGFQDKRARISAMAKSNQIKLDSQLNLSSNAVHRNSVKDSLLREESEAEPADGWTNYDIYVDNNIRIPNINQPSAKSGIVELSFTVNKNGLLTNFKIEHSLDAASDREAIRLVKEGPRWEITSGEDPVRISLMIFF